MNETMFSREAFTFLRICTHRSQITQPVHPSGLSLKEDDVRLAINHMTPLVWPLRRGQAKPFYYGPFNSRKQETEFVSVAHRSDHSYHLDSDFTAHAFYEGLMFSPSVYDH